MTKAGKQVWTNAYRYSIIRYSDINDRSDWVELETDFICITQSRWVFYLIICWCCLIQIFKMFSLSSFFRDPKLSAWRSAFITWSKYLWGFFLGKWKHLYGSFTVFPLNARQLCPSWNNQWQPFSCCNNNMPWFEWLVPRNIPVSELYQTECSRWLVTAYLRWTQKYPSSTFFRKTWRWLQAELPYELFESLECNWKFC